MLSDVSGRSDHAVMAVVVVDLAAMLTVVAGTGGRG